MMEVIVARPPNFDAIVKIFPNAASPGVIFCYGSAIYAPSGSHLVTKSLQAHEQVHSERQGRDPDAWWAQYLVDSEFRFLEELPAHQAEYRTLAEDAPHRNARRFYLKDVAKKLSGPLYGHMVTEAEARRLLKRED